MFFGGHYAGEGLKNWNGSPAKIDKTSIGLKYSESAPESLVKNIAITGSPHAVVNININYPQPPKVDRLKADKSSPIHEQFKLAKNEIENFYNKAEIAYKEKNFEKALIYYKKSAQIIELPVVLLAIANTHLVLRNFGESLQEAEKASRNVESVPQEDRMKFQADIYNLMGIASLEEKKYIEANKHFNNSLKLLRELSRGKAKEALADLAGALNNIAIVEQRLGRFENAEKQLKESKDIFNNLSNENPARFYNNLAMAYYNLGSLEDEWHKPDRLQNAITYFQNAIELYRKNGKKSLAENKQMVGLCLLRLGGLHSNDAQIKAFASVPLKAIGFPIPVKYEDAYKAADNCYNKAINIFEELSQNEPKFYSPDLGTTLNSYGTFLIDWKHYEKASQYLGRALEIRKSIANDNTKTSLENLAGTLINIGKLSTINDADEDAKNYYDEAKQIYDKIDPESQGMAILVNNLGRLYLKMKDYTKAENNLLRSYGICCSLMKTHPWKHKSLFNIITGNLILLYKNTGNKTSENKYSEILKSMKSGENTKCWSE